MHKHCSLKSSIYPQGPEAHRALLRSAMELAGLAGRCSTGVLGFKSGQLRLRFGGFGVQGTGLGLEVLGFRV